MVLQQNLEIKDGGRREKKIKKTKKRRGKVEERDQSISSPAHYKSVSRFFYFLLFYTWYILYIYENTNKIGILLKSIECFWYFNSINEYILILTFC